MSISFDSWSGLEPGFDRAIMRPISQASGLPNLTYTSPDYARFERDQLFANTWTCVGCRADIPEPGDLLPVDLLGLPLLLLRDYDSTIRVFHNVCSHRGMKLVSRPGRTGKVIRCPYHSWAYDLQGGLRATPHIGGPRRHRCEGFDKAARGLKSVRSAVWFDQIFVNISGDAPDFADHISPLAERWQAFDQGVLRHGGADSRLSFDVGCNWKLAVENYCEAYHLPWVHPGLNSYSRLEDHYSIELDGHFSGQGTWIYAPNLGVAGPDFPHFPGLPADWQSKAEYIALYPNLLLGMHRDHFYAVRLEPMGPARTLEHFEIYYVGDAALGEAFAPRRRANAEQWRMVFAEDVLPVEGMQAGRESPAFAGGAFSPAMDGPTHCFHRWVAAQLARALNGPPTALSA